MKTPCFRFTLHLTEYPASLGTVTKRWSQRPLADASAWSEARIITIGDISRSCTDQDGNYELSQFQIELSDDDHAIRTLLETAGTQYFYGRQGELEILSEAGRSAALAWRAIFRGVVTDVQTPAQHRASVTLKDLVGSRFSGFDLDKTIGLFLGDEHTNIEEKNRKLIYPIIVGEWSDQGAIDSTGASAEKGMLPLIDSGDYDISGAVSPSPPSIGQPPTITSATVIGGTGNTTYTYAAILVTPYGWSALGSPVTVTNAPAVAQMTQAFYVDLRISFDPGDPANLNKVVIAGRSSNPPTTFLDEIDYINHATGSGVYFDGAKADSTPVATRDEVDIEHQLPPLADGGVMQGPSGVWGRFVVSIGATDVHQLYWSDLADQTEPKRTLADPDLDGVEFLTPSSAGWPHSDPWIELDNPVTGETIRMTVVYVRGLRAVAHRDGSVTMAVNGCGMEEVGDGSGLMVDEAFKAGQLFLNEHILKDQGTGYRNGDYGPLETFANGDAQIQTTSWAAAQTITVNRIGGAGYMAAWTIHQPITVREWVRRFCLTFDCRLAVNQHGQIKPVIIDDLANPSLGRAYREFVEGAILLEQPLMHDEIENRITFSYDYDPDAQAFRVVNQVIQDDPSIAAHVPGGVAGNPNPAGVHEGPVQELFCVRDPATALDARARRLTRNKKAPRLVTFASSDDLRGLEDDLGAQIRFTHRDGKGVTGDSLTPLCVLKNVVHASYGSMGYELTGMDIQRIATNGGLTLAFTLATTAELR